MTTNVIEVPSISPPSALTRKESAGYGTFASSHRMKIAFLPSALFAIGSSTPVILFT